MSTEREREALRQQWRDLSGSKMPPIATRLGRCPECGKWRGVRGGALNDHRGEFFECHGSGRAAAEVVDL